MRKTFLALLMVAGLVTPAAFAEDNDLGNLVVAGDSLSAGYQNSQLIDCSLGGPAPCFGKPSGQRFGYANVIAHQAGVDLKLPLLQPPGFPQITLMDGFAVATGIAGPIRADGGANQTLNVSVPGFTIESMVGYSPVCPAIAGDPQEPLPIRILAQTILNPGCATPAAPELFEAAGVAQANPGTTIFWIGSNNALFPLLFSGVPVNADPNFNPAYDFAISTLAGASKHLVVANIPDVTLLPYLISVPKLAAILNQPVPAVQFVYQLNPGDMVTPYAFNFLAAAKPLPSDDGIGDPVVIRAADIATLRQTIAQYNAKIAADAAAAHATLVDIYSLVNDIAAHGVHAGGQKLTTDFMGGLFSLDGVHPTNTGYAVIANEFIKTMNRQLHVGIPPVAIEQVAKTDPMVFPSDKQGKGHVSPGMADALHQTMGHHRP